MALWGNKDSVYSTGNVNVNVTTGVVTKQSGSIAWTAGNGVKVGQIMTIDGTSEGVITGITSATQLTIGTQFLPSSNISNKGYVISEKPKSTLSLYISGWFTKTRGRFDSIKAASSIKYFGKRWAFTQLDCSKPALATKGALTSSTAPMYPYFLKSL